MMISSLDYLISLLIILTALRFFIILGDLLAYAVI